MGLRTMTDLQRVKQIRKKGRAIADPEADDEVASKKNYMDSMRQQLRDQEEAKKRAEELDKAR